MPKTKGKTIKKKKITKKKPVKKKIVKMLNNQNTQKTKIIGTNKLEKEQPEVEINVKLQEATEAEVVVDDNKSKKEVLDSIFAGERILVEKSDDANELYNHARYGILLEDGKLQLSLLEALYLLEKGRVNILTSAKRKLSFENFLKRAKKLEPTFWIRYVVFKDMRNRGYIVKTALKFGADFRIYDRGIKPGEDHARWVVYPVHEGSTLTWYDFAAKNRVAHSTKKRLLMAVVDDENDVTYYEVRWMRP